MHSNPYRETSYPTLKLGENPVCSECCSVLMNLAVLRVLRFLVVTGDASRFLCCCHRRRIAFRCDCSPLLVTLDSINMAREHRYTDAYTTVLKKLTKVLSSVSSVQRLSQFRRSSQRFSSENSKQHIPFCTNAVFPYPDRLTDLQKSRQRSEDPDRFID
jgi:hypothetical protein